MSLDDGQSVVVTFACCGKQRLEKFADLKAGTLNDGFICPFSGHRVKYDGHEFVRLMNEEALNATHKITLYPAEE